MESTHRETVSLHVIEKGDSQECGREGEDKAGATRAGGSMRGASVKVANERTPYLSAEETALLTACSPALRRTAETRR
jgi:hypothetical protein